jgi:hypothetical protein
MGFHGNMAEVADHVGQIHDDQRIVVDHQDRCSFHRRVHGAPPLLFPALAGSLFPIQRAREGCALRAEPASGFLPSVRLCL